MRRSRKKTFFGFVYRWRGLQRYRCRECEKSFYRPLLPDGVAGSSSQEPRRRSRSERLAARKKRQRRKVELLVFLGMLAIFYVALRALTHSS